MIATSRQSIDADLDAELMLSARDGDCEAFEQLTTRYWQRVVDTVTYLMGSNFQSEDLTQDVFLRAFRARGTYVASAKFSTWLFTITKNVVSNARRGAARRSAAYARFRRRSTNVSFDPLHLVTQAETQLIVHHAIARLCDRQRIAISLVALEGASYSAAAAEMGISESAVKSLVFRAKENLRPSLSFLVREGRQSSRPLLAKGPGSLETEECSIADGEHTVRDSGWQHTGSK